MIAVDSNVFVALWDPLRDDNARATRALAEARRGGTLVVSPPVYAELASGPSRDPAWVDEFFRETGIVVDWDLDEAVWRRTAVAYRDYATRRKRAGDGGPRRILADFIIGAHASVRNCPLLTMDERIFRTAFPELAVIRV